VSLAIAMSEATSRAEHELLLCAICPDQLPASDERMRSLAASPLDWDYLFILARRHGVLQLLYFRLQQYADLMPPDQLQRLQKYFQENSARNVLLTAELCRLIDLLGKEGIEAIPFKGPVLALFAYGNIALRRFVDLDVMVRREDVDRAIDIFIAEGYELSKSLTSSQREVLLRTQHNLQFRRHHRQLIVELHWEVASHLFASSVQADDLWTNLIELDLNQSKLKTLAPEDLIFSLCVHGSRHLWERLLWICDIGWIAARHDLNWPRLLERSRATKTERMFLLGLHLSSKLLNVRLPAQILQESEQDVQLDQLAAAVIRSAFNRVEHIPATRGQILSYNWKIRKAWSSRARYLRHALNPTDRDLDAVALPGPLSFGYYLMRPFRLLFKSPSMPVSEDPNPPQIVKKSR
jgi:hypothetical protein